MFTGQHCRESLLWGALQMLRRKGRPGAHRQHWAEGMVALPFSYTETRFQESVITLAG